MALGHDGQWIVACDLSVGAGFPVALGHPELKLGESLTGTALHGDTRLSLELIQRLAALFYGLANVAVGYASTNTYIHGDSLRRPLHWQIEIDNYYHNSRPDFIRLTRSQHEAYI